APPRPSGGKVGEGNEAPPYARTTLAFLRGRRLRAPRASWGGGRSDLVARLVEDTARAPRDMAQQPQDDDRRHAGQPLPDDAGLGSRSPPVLQRRLPPRTGGQAP